MIVMRVTNTFMGPFAEKLHGWAADRARMLEKRRLSDLQRLSMPDESFGGEPAGISAKDLQDRLGRAGFADEKSRRRIKMIGAICLLSSTLLPAAFVFERGSAAAGFALFAGAYLGLLGWLFFLRCRAAEVRRKVLFELPIFLESLVLLVEAGLGVLPALQRLVSQKTESQPTYLQRLLELTYSLTAAGIPFSDALRSTGECCDIVVVRHTLLHLDISGTEGGELIPALRSLSDHAHSEWKLSVENRVRRLENLVVFPVFVAVLGLMCLAAAVPLVPVIDFFETLPARQQSASAIVNGPTDLSKRR